MKKVRSMLMYICLVALVGGVLAFKARKPQAYCTTVARTYTTGPVSPIYYTCKDVQNIDLLCGQNSVITIYTPFNTELWPIICTILADGDSQPCRAGVSSNDPLRHCPNKATTTIEIQ